jgi:hypothetical protein
MKRSKTISKLRKHIARNRKTYTVSLIFFLVGLIVTVQTFFQVAGLFDIFSPQTKNIIILSLFSVSILLLIAYLLLKNNLERHKKYLKQYAPPAFNIDDQEEYDEAWDEAAKEDK